MWLKLPVLFKNFFVFAPFAPWQAREIEQILVQSLTLYENSTPWNPSPFLRKLFKNENAPYLLSYWIYKEIGNFLESEPSFYVYDQKMIQPKANMKIPFRDIFSWQIFPFLFGKKDPFLILFPPDLGWKYWCLIRVGSIPARFPFIPGRFWTGKRILFLEKDWKRLLDFFVWGVEVEKGNIVRIPLISRLFPFFENTKRG